MQRRATVTVARIHVGFTRDQLVNRCDIAAMRRDVQTGIASDFCRVGRDLRSGGCSVNAEADGRGDHERKQVQVHDAGLRFT